MMSTSRLSGRPDVAMTEFRHVNDSFSVAWQIAPDDVRAAADQGFKLVINNRPDGEAPGQPSSDEIEAAARAAGLDYVHIPVVGRPSPDAVRAEYEALSSAGGPAL